MELHSRRFFGSLCLAVLFGPLSGCGAVVDLPVTADTFITSGAPGNNAGVHAWFDAGTDGFLGGNAVRRGLLRFDLSSIPAGSTVTSAEVRLTVSRVPGIGPVDSTFDLSRLLVAWGEGTNTGNAGAPAVAGEATWNARLSGTANWTVVWRLDCPYYPASALKMGLPVVINLQRIMTARGEYDLAIAAYDRSIELNPDMAGAYLGRGYAYFRKGDFDPAIQDYNRAIELEPQLARAYMNRGYLYGRLGDSERAITDYTQAIALDPQIADAYYNRGTEYMQLGDYDQALLDFNLAIEMDSEMFDAYNNRGNV